MFKMTLSVMMNMSIMILVLTNNTMNMGLTIVLQSMLLAYLINQSFFLNWFSFILFMVFLGGILMLFCYMISLTKMKSKMILFKKTTILIFLFCFINMSEEMVLKPKKEISWLFLNLYSKSMKISIFMMLFLLLLMIMVVFLTESSKSSMRVSNWVNMKHYLH